MTDSGSFDSGDLMYGTDLQALHALVTSKCSAAGVAGPGYASSVFATGNVCAAAHVNDLVAAYQRAWDASANKPGTRQGQVSAGGLIYGALFQNMWTQLGQMTFNPLESWDESGEAGIASSDIFCCFMENTTAGGNEAGQGGGVSNATVTQGGSVAGASGTPPSRQFDGSNDLMLFPMASLAQLITDNTWTLLWKCEAVSAPAGGGTVMEMTSSDVAERIQLLLYSGGSMGLSVVAGGSGIVSTNPSFGIPTSGIVYIALFSTGTRIYLGWGNTKPTSIADFGSNIVYSNTTSFPNFSGKSPYGGALNSIFGGETVNYRWLAGKLRYFLASKTCLFA